MPIYERPFVYHNSVGRPRTVDDETLLDAALAIISETGPDSLSFGALAARVDIAGSTLVQRFESKANLLQSALLLAWDRLDADTAQAIGRAGDGSKGVIQLLVSLSGHHQSANRSVDGTDDFANQLLLLREDLRDRVLRARGQAWLAELTIAIDTRLSAPLGQLVLTHWQGTLTMWAFQRRRTLTADVRRALRELFNQLGLQ
jgi:AcrR family transcriptional regulator